MNTLTLVTPPALEPVTLAEAKAQLRVGDTADDVLISSLIVVARQVGEQILNRALITQTLKLQCDEVPDGVLQLPRAPVQSITHIKVYDDTDVAVTLSSSLYQLASDGRVALRQAASWPQVWRALGGFEVQYVAGYGATAGDIPAAIRQGILAHITHLYNHRGDQLNREGRTTPLYAVPQQALSLYAPYRILPGLA